MPACGQTRNYLSDLPIVTTNQNDGTRQCLQFVFEREMFVID